MTSWCMGGPKNCEWDDWDADQVFCIGQDGRCTRYERAGYLETEHGNGQWYNIYMMADQFLTGLPATSFSTNTTTPAGRVLVITHNGNRLQEALLMSGDVLSVHFANGKVDIFAH